MQKLDEERPRWRKDSILLCDGAPYHTNQATLDVFKEYEVPIMILAPHSYSVAPAELLFAWFKQKDVNPRHHKQSKTHICVRME